VIMPEDVSSDAVRDCVSVRFLLPPDLPVGAELTIGVTVAGERSSPPLEHRARIIRGVSPTLRLADVVSIDGYRVPVASASGALYLPHNSQKHGPGTDPGEVSVYDPLGQVVEPLRKLPTLTKRSNLVAAVAELPSPGSGPLLLLCGCAADPATGRPFDRLSMEAYRSETLSDAASPMPGALWTASITPGAVNGLSESDIPGEVDTPCVTSCSYLLALPAWPFYCFGMSALPRMGVLVVSVCAGEGLIAVHSLATGAQLCVTKAAYATFVRTDDASGLIYVSNKVAHDFCVSTFRWDGTSLTSQVRTEEAGAPVG